MIKMIKCVDSGGIDVAVTEDVSEAHYILLDGVIGASEEVAVIVL